MILIISPKYSASAPAFLRQLMQNRTEATMMFSKQRPHTIENDLIRLTAAVLLSAILLCTIISNVIYIKSIMKTLNVITMICSRRFHKAAILIFRI